jgi:hypothetical protein
MDSGFAEAWTPEANRLGDMGASFPFEFQVRRRSLQRLPPTVP